MSARQDRGLRAVTRVREVRERDSRLGLRSAAEEERAAREFAALLDQEVARHAADSAAPGEAGHWAGRRQGLMALAAGASQGRATAEAAGVLRTSAEAHWQHDRSRLRSAERLLENRAEERRLAAAAAAARELDDVAGRAWLRRQREGT